MSVMPATCEFDPLESARMWCKECWHSLGTVERSTLLHHFLADGIEDLAFVFEFLPDCVANAVRNPNIGLTCLLEMLVCLLNTLQPAAPGMLANLSDCTLAFQGFLPLSRLRPDVVGSFLHVRHL